MVTCRRVANIGQTPAVVAAGNVCDERHTKSVGLCVPVHRTAAGAGSRSFHGERRAQAWCWRTCVPTASAGLGAQAATNLGPYDVPGRRSVAETRDHRAPQQRARGRPRRVDAHSHSLLIAKDLRRHRPSVTGSRWQARCAAARFRFGPAPRSIEISRSSALLNPALRTLLAPTKGH